MKGREIKDKNWWKNWSENRVDIKNFKKDSDKICYYCGKLITKKEELTVDHVVPLSKGGENAADNYVISCKPCNSEKANLNPERYAEFLNISSTMTENSSVVESVEKAINGFREIMINLNSELYTAKAKLAEAEKRRIAILDSMMFKKFNVIQGYDYAKELRNLTEEIYSLKINIAQMNKIHGNINQVSPFINNINSKGVMKEAVSKVRGDILADYRAAFTDEKPKESPAKSEPPAVAEPEGQTG